MQFKQEHKIYFIFSFWILVLIVGIATTLYTNRTVTHNYYDAALDWLNHTDMYNSQGAGFIYFPQSAIFYIPLAKIPFWLSEIIWRALNFFIILYGSWSYMKLISANKNQYVLALFVLSALFLPTMFSSFQMGQMNLTIIALSLLSMLAIEKDQFKLAAFLIILCLAFKPTTIVIVLLFAYFYPKMRISMLIATLFFVLLPFLTTFDWHYVIYEYQQCYIKLTTASDVGNNYSTQWSQIFNVFDLITNSHVSDLVQRIVRLIAALIVLGALIKAYKETKNTHLFLWTLYALFSSYLMVFNPRTENTDYCIVTIAIAVFCIFNLAHKKYFTAAILVLINIGILVASNISKVFTPENDHWFTPIMALIFFIYIIIISLAKNSVIKMPNAINVEK
ncbi:MAG: hypothetical protein ACJA0H_000864 [Francisellaceae bacterium]|jgi:hypothetical protein